MSNLIAPGEGCRNSPQVTVVGEIVDGKRRTMDLRRAAALSPRERLQRTLDRTCELHESLPRWARQAISVDWGFR